MTVKQHFFFWLLFTLKNALLGDILKKLHTCEDVNVQARAYSKSPMVFKAATEESSVVQ
jgi:hypothetical protein